MSPRRAVEHYEHHKHINPVPMPDADGCSFQVPPVNLREELAELGSWRIWRSA